MQIFIILYESFLLYLASKKGGVPIIIGTWVGAKVSKIPTLVGTEKPVSSLKLLSLVEFWKRIPWQSTIRIFYHK